MPELPEVEYAAKRLRRATRGRTITAVRALHASQRRALGRTAAGRLRGRRIARIERLGKHQFIHLDDGAVLAVHFRLDGDWEFARAADAPPRHARVVIDLDDGSRVALVDPRALSTVRWYAKGAHPELELGPDPEDRSVTPATLHAALARKRGPIKPVLLDQALLAGVGNIYAAEACWRARIDPRRPAASLTPGEVRRLLTGLRKALEDGHVNAGTYRTGKRTRPFKVYDREGKACARCGTTIERITQGGRSTYLCPSCQR